MLKSSGSIPKVGIGVTNGSIVTHVLMQLIRLGNLSAECK